MLSLIKQSKYARKMVALPDGSLAVVVFELFEINGEIKARPVYGKVLENFTQEKVLALPTVSTSTPILPAKSICFEYVQNFLRDLTFFVSQPSRAPNLA